MSCLLPTFFFDLSKYQHAALFSDCKYVWEAFSKIEKYLASKTLGKIETKVPEGVYLINPECISIGKGTTLEPGAYIKGPCIIGENCVVRHGAYIRGDFNCRQWMRHWARHRSKTLDFSRWSACCSFRLCRGFHSGK